MGKNAKLRPNGACPLYLVCLHVSLQRKTSAVFNFRTNFRANCFKEQESRCGSNLPGCFHFLPPYLANYKRTFDVDQIASQTKSLQTERSIADTNFFLKKSRRKKIAEVLIFCLKFLERSSGGLFFQQKIATNLFLIETYCSIKFKGNVFLFYINNVSTSAITRLTMVINSESFCTITEHIIGLSIPHALPNATLELIKT